ncbi:PEP-CTERM protein-sorting domain-containing protein [Polaromonas sp. OV174]|nr:PEP-CTERM protein-sorting domain-containing protein [Polaromonas sp. OV174]
MSVNNTVVDTYTGFTGNVPDINNGNGYADYLLGNFPPFSATDQVQFSFRDANDGPEMIFVASTPSSTVPEPATLTHLGLGLLCACFARRRRS